MRFETHLGERVSALLDGCMSATEEERAWAHVHRCAQCRQLVECEGWVKTRLSGLAPQAPGASPALKGLLAAPEAGCSTSYASACPPMTHENAARRLTAIGAGSLGAAMLGVVALSSAAQAPALDRRAPISGYVERTGPAASLTADRTRPARDRAQLREVAVRIGGNSK